MVKLQGDESLSKEHTRFSQNFRKKGNKVPKGAQKIFSIIWWGKLIRWEEDFLGGTNPGGNYVLLQFSLDKISINFAILQFFGEIC